MTGCAACGADGAVRYTWAEAGQQRANYLCEPCAPTGAIAEPWTEPLEHLALSNHIGTRQYAARKLRDRRIALGLSIAEIAAITHRSVDEYALVEGGGSIDSHWSSQFVLASALGILEEQARADVETWLREHPAASPAGLSVVHPARVLLGPSRWGI